MRISDWSSDVCSSDLPAPRAFDLLLLDAPYGTGAGSVALDKLTRLGWVGPESWVSIATAEKEAVEIAGFEIDAERRVGKARLPLLRRVQDRKSVVQGKRVSVRVDFGGARIIKNNKYIFLTSMFNALCITH